jgi:cytochrome c-type biogenesis protein CcmI
MIIAAQLLLTLGVLAFILTPLILNRGERSWMEPELEAKRRSIAERKARLYGQLLDLDFDRDSGKISAEDHTRLREEIMAEVVQVLAEEEKTVPQGQRRPVVLEGGDRVERMIEEYKRARRPEAGAAR